MSTQKEHEIQGAVRKLQNLQVPPSVRLDQAVRPEDLSLRRNLLSEVMVQALSKVLKVIRDPRLAVALVNAQVRMQGRAQVPLSVRLYGKIHIAGKGEVVFGQGVSLTGTVVPIEFVSRRDARMTTRSSITVHRYPPTNWFLWAATVFWAITLSSSTTTSTTASSIT